MILDLSTTGYDEPPVVGLLGGAFQLARELATGYPQTGWRWRRPPRLCPGWCARDHTCTVRPRVGLGPRGDGYQDVGPLSEHRSPVTSWKMPYGSMVATRVQALERGARLELRTQVRLSNESERLALVQAVNLPIVVDRAIQTLMTELELQARMRAVEARERAVAARELLALTGQEHHIPPPGPSDFRVEVPEPVKAGYLAWGSW